MFVVPVQRIGSKGLCGDRKVLRGPAYILVYFISINIDIMGENYTKERLAIASWLNLTKLPITNLKKVICPIYRGSPCLIIH